MTTRTDATLVRVRSTIRGTLSLDMFSQEDAISPTATSPEKFVIQMKVKDAEKNKPEKTREVSASKDYLQNYDFISF